MIKNLISNSLTDWEYDSRLLWYMQHYHNNLPDIYRISHLDADIELVTEMTSKSDSYILFIKGNENHECFDNLYEDPKLLSIIKNYPALVNHGKKVDGEQSYAAPLINGVPRYETITEDERTINIPLGYCNGFKPFPRRSRAINRFFCGQTTTNRVKWIDFINNIDKFGDDDIYGFYKGFAGIEKQRENALNRNDYAITLGNSDIALCPAGHSPETFRLAEAALSGCAIIHEVLPNTEYYSEMPGIVITYGIWQKSDEEVIEWLRPKMKIIYENIIELSNQSMLWYNKWVEESSCSKRILNHLRRINVA